MGSSIPVVNGDLHIRFLFWLEILFRGQNKGAYPPDNGPWKYSATCCARKLSNAPICAVEACLLLFAAATLKNCLLTLRDASMFCRCCCATVKPWRECKLPGFVNPAPALDWWGQAAKTCSRRRPRRVLDLRRWGHLILGRAWRAPRRHQAAKRNTTIPLKCANSRNHHADPSQQSSTVLDSPPTRPPDGSHEQLDDRACPDGRIATFSWPRGSAVLLPACAFACLCFAGHTRRTKGPRRSAKCFTARGCQ